MVPSDQTPPPEARGTALAEALRAILRPLARAMIARGLTLPAAIAIMKQVLVEVAEEELGSEGGRPSDSRIALSTGVHRKDVKALRSQETPAAPARRSASLLATVIGRWLGDPRYRGADGEPRALPRQSSAGEASFESLIEEISKDVRPRSVLDEMERQHLVAIEPDSELVTLDAHAFVPRADSAERLGYYRDNLTDHAAAATANLLTEEGPAPFLERALYYNGLSDAALADIEALARERGMALLEDLNAEALTRQDAEEDDAAAHGRFRFGIYFYKDSDDDAQGGTS